MSLIYPDTIRPEPQPTVPEMMAREAETATPVYARGPVRRGKVRSWMILAPVGALTVAAIGAWALMNPGEDAAAPAEPAALISAPVASAESAPLEGEALETGLASEALARENPAADAVTTAPPASAPAPTPAPAARPTPAASAPARQAEPAAPVEAAAPAGPQSYESVVAAEGEGGAVTAPAAETPAPLIVVEPN
jgi:hypothetical protein